MTLDDLDDIFNFVPTLKELQAEFDAAQRAFRTVDDAWLCERDAMKRIAQRNIDLFLETIYGKEHRLLLRKKGELLAKVQAEKERLALEGTNAPYPLGTKLYKEEGTKFNRKTTFGVLEAVISTTQFPDNLPNQSRPSIGSFVVRCLKQDGTPSKTIDRYFNSWTPVDSEVRKFVPFPIEV